ncbi:hypothetical protein ACYZT9_01570 [Pseudomonas sp. ZT5P21]
MNTESYATPISSLEATEPAQPTFYVVSQRKFILLFLTTQGWYLIYWFYKNWKLYRAATGTKVMPIVRTILLIFFVHSLFTRINRRIVVSGQRYSWYPRSVALVFIFACVLGAGQVWVWEQYLKTALAMLSLFLQTACLVYVQTAINYGESDAEGVANSRLTFANGMWVSLGLCIWALLALGVYTELAGIAY